MKVSSSPVIIRNQVLWIQVYHNHTHKGTGLSITTQATQSGQLSQQNKLLTCFDLSECKECNSDITVDVPLLGFAVRLAAVVHEPRVVAFWTGIDDPEWLGRCQMMMMTRIVVMMMIVLVNVIVEMMMMIKMVVMLIW